MLLTSGKMVEYIFPENIFFLNLSNFVSRVEFELHYECSAQ